MTAWTTPPDFGEAVLWAIVTSESWHHRKVESLRLVDGPQSLRRVSIDVTIPNDPRLIVNAPGPGAQGEVFVPMAIIQKARLQSFDARFDGSSPLPIAETALNGFALESAIVAAWKLGTDTQPTAQQRGVIHDIVFDRGDTDIEERVGLFLDSNVWKGEDVLRPSLDGLTTRLLELAGPNFLLGGLLSSELMGLHKILKYQEHWELIGVDKVARVPYEERFFSSLGWDPSPLEIQLNDAGLTPASYHLEIHSPSGLMNQNLELLANGFVVAEDKRSTVVSHAVHRPAGPLSLPSSAIVYLRTSPYGLLPWAMLAYTFSAVFVLGCLVFPVLERLLDPNARAGAPVFLAVIAVLLGFVSRTSENPLSGKVLSLLRLAITALAVLYFAMALAVVLAVPIVFARGLWLIAFIVTGGISAVLIFGWVKSRRVAVRHN